MSRRMNPCRAALGLSTIALLFVSSSLAARADGEAIPGVPFGVGRLTVRLSPEDAVLHGSNALLLTEETGRVHYPAFTSGPVRRLLSEVLGAAPILSNIDSSAPSSVTILFLFTGEAPLRLNLSTSRGYSAVVTPARRPPRQHARLLRTWWREYSANARQQVAAGDYPPLMETYLTTMLGQRLGMQPPLLSQIKSGSDSSELRQTLELLFGVEKLHAATMKETLQKQGGFGEPANRPVPADVVWTPPKTFELRPDVEIEPLAMQVPEECFYVRFGNFDNYIWLSHLLEEFAADASRVINIRGHDSGANQRLQRQIALKQSKVGEIFGSQVIADVAMIGRDFYMGDGAAFGILFQAKNNGILSSDFRNQRRAAEKEFAEAGATMTNVKVGGHEVSFLSTPDNTLRSFYAQQGDFHLVTTSRRIVERFFEISDGKGSLGASAEFRHARTRMPVSREDTVFAYMSSAFFRGLVSPHYQIELARRMRSVTDMELVELARLAARSEGKPHASIDDLVAARVLPSGFGLRPDGSGPIMTDQGVIDSMRGSRGTFTPIPDVTLHSVTRTEEVRYATRAAYYSSHWRQMDPLMVGAKRYALDKKGKERIVIDANISPLDEHKYGWVLSLLGPPTRERITAAPGDIVSAQVSVKGGLLLPSVPPHYLFVGVQDTAPPPTNLKPTGFFQVLQILKTTPGYLGGWPKPGFLDMLPFGLGGGHPDAAGYSRLLFGLWRRQFAGFSLLSFDPGILEHVSPHLRPEPTDNAAQIRVRIGDISQSKLNGWVTSMNYQRAAQTTQGNVRLLHALSQQLNVPREEALETAERLLGVRLICSLGGEYAMRELSDTHRIWQTTKLPETEIRQLPEDYQSPLLKWFRGLSVDLTKLDHQIQTHAELDMQRKPSEATISLPSFDIFGSKKKSKKPAETAPVDEKEKGKKKSREF